MLKTLGAVKDTYITDKVVLHSRMTGSNVGAAGSLDLFKLYGMSMSGTSPNTELSRILVHFDLTDLKSLVSEGKVAIDDSSFWCKLKLSDVYGGQPTPSLFTVSVFPLSASFEEGLGRDTSYYSDYDWASWMSSSYGTPWIMTGCAAPCFATGIGDYITSSHSIPTTEVTQYFKTGEEDLVVDVTKIVSATLTGELPDSGLRISFQNSIEVNQRTYFVKRFGSRHSYDESKHPKLIVGFDDSITDDSQNLTLDTPCDVVLYNYAGGGLTNIVSGSSFTPITGSDCLVLKLTTVVSGGTYDLFFDGSQYSLGSDRNGSCPVTGTYFSTVTIPSSDAYIAEKLAVSSSLKFTPVWTSLDGTVAYVTGSVLTVTPPDRTPSRRLKKFVVSVVGLRDSYAKGDELTARVNVFDQTSPLVKVTRVPVELPGVVVKSVYYQVRDTVTNEVVVPFDDVKNSTKVSSDSEGMFFKMDVSGLTTGRTYVVDIMISHDGTKTKYTNISPVFRVENVNPQQ
jgi:hypothetical protein